MKAKVCHSLEELDTAGSGAIYRTPDTLFFNCPGGPCPTGHNGEAGIPVNPERQAGKAWGISGDNEHITLTPSVFKCHGCTHAGKHCEWHGWLQNGEWRSV